LKCEKLAEDEQVLFLHSAKLRPARGKYQEQISFHVTLDEPNGKAGKVTLTRNEERDDLMSELNADDTEPIGPVVVVKAEGGQRGYYWAFEPANVESVTPAKGGKGKK
jgi:hypothetical protein